MNSFVVDGIEETIWVDKSGKFIDICKSWSQADRRGYQSFRISKDSAEFLRDKLIEILKGDEKCE